MVMVALLVASLSLLGPDTWELNAFMTKMGYKKEKEASVVSGIRLDFVRYSYAPSKTGGGQGPANGKAVGPKPVPTVRNEVQILATSERQSQNPSWGALKHTHHLESSYLGIRDGYHYYALAPIPESLSVQKHLKLQGGVDWQWLAAKGTATEDEGTYTANSCLYLFREGDDRGLQHLLVFASQDPKKSWHAILGIGNIPTQLATDQLIALYRSKSDDYRGAAAYALIHKPFRKAAKAEYIDMISKGMYVGEAAKAAVEGQWQDAIPALHLAIEKPEYVGTLIAALEAERTLTGKSIPEAVSEAGRLPLNASPQQITAAKSVLLVHPDKQVVAAYAYRYANLRAKSNTTNLEKLGREILESLSPTDRDWVLGKFKD